MNSEQGIKQSARGKVRDALKRGDLRRPELCSRCLSPSPPGSDGRATIHAHHHNGYELPLDVEWLCVKCHFQEDVRVQGVEVGSSKLNPEAVTDIRARYNPNANRWHPRDGISWLAKEYQVSTRTVQRVVAGKLWRSVPIPASQSLGKSGLRGVERHGRRFRAIIHHGGKRRIIGSYETREEAHEAYRIQASQPKTEEG